MKPNRFAVVTGAGHRLGRAIALALASEGYAIGIHYFKSEEAARSLSKEIEQAGCRSILLHADLRVPAEIERMFEQIGSGFGRLDVLVNSAAVMTKTNILEPDHLDWENTLRVNLTAPWLCSIHAARLMTSGGAIINISDTGAKKTWTGFPAYELSKAGLEKLTTLLAKALAPNIRVNAVAPGLILQGADTDDETWNRLVGRVPAKRPGTMEEIAQAVVMLVKNEYITGQTLAVDGGYQLI